MEKMMRQFVTHLLSVITISVAFIAVEYAMVYVSPSYVIQREKLVYQGIAIFFYIISHVVYTTLLLPAKK